MTDFDEPTIQAIRAFVKHAGCEDVGEENATRPPYLVMEYVAARTLEKFVANEVPRLRRQHGEFCRNSPGTEFEKAVYEGIRNRQRLMVGHAWGDRGLDLLFQTIERAIANDPAITLDYIRSRRFTSDHCGLYPRPDQLATFKKYNWILSCQGNGYRRNLSWLENVYGWDPFEKWIQPVKSILDAGHPGGV